MAVAQVQWMRSPSGYVVQVSLDQVSQAIALDYQPLGSPVEFGTPAPTQTATPQTPQPQTPQSQPSAPPGYQVDQGRQLFWDPKAYDVENMVQGKWVPFGTPPVKGGKTDSGYVPGQMPQPVTMRYFDANGEPLPNATGAAYSVDSNGKFTQLGGTTTTAGGGTTMPVTTSQNALGEADLYGQYLNQFNIPAFGASPFQKWQARQAAPTLGAYVMQSQQNPSITLADYLGQTGIMGARQQLPGAYNALMANPDRGVVDWAKQSLGELWNDVMGGVASAKYGRFFGPQLAQAYPQMQRQFEATPAGFEAPGESSFLDYLRQRYGI